MIFEGRSLDAVSDDEIRNIVVEHVEERQQLEFKLSVNNTSDQERLELLKDIASLANGGGGYMFVGIRDDGQGRAQLFEPGAVTNAESLRSSIRDLALEHIRPRITGLEVRTRVVEGHSLVAVHCPPSPHRPHMVTFRRGTHFVSRYEDGKREMTLEEIRAAFQDDATARAVETLRVRVDSLASGLGVEIERRRLSHEEPATILEAADGVALAEFLEDRFLRDAQEEPFFWLGATPENPELGLLPADKAGLIELMESPGGRAQGWNLRTGATSSQRFELGRHVGSPEYRYLEVFENGHVGLWVPIDWRFRHGRIETAETNPYLSPYPLVEYTVSFVRFVRSLYRLLSVKAQVILSAVLANVVQTHLIPGVPGELRYDAPTKVGMNSQRIIRPPRVRAAAQGLKDADARRLLERIYLAYGLESGDIPLFDESLQFTLDSDS